MSFELIKKNFGFGCMRLPMKDDEVDLEEFSKMVDYFIDNGFNYFDTAHPYHKGKSEIAVKACLTSRHKRDEYLLANKLTGNYFEKEEDIVPLFKSQLELCGVDYFDFYLMHAQNRVNYQKFKACHAYQIAFDLKKQGLVKHVGLSFHDTSDILDMILTENPEIEFVQLQFNYVDIDSPSIQSMENYKVCVKHGKRVVVMEPVKGGNLVNLPEEAMNVFKKLGDNSAASYALRYAAGFDNIYMVLSGMGNMNMMIDNVKTMKDFKPLTKEENEAIKEVKKILKEKTLVECTGCNYCTASCPMHIQIPDLFNALNSKVVYNDWSVLYYYNNALKVKASACIKCGQCEKQCPQGLKIRELLEKVVEVFEK